MDRTYQVRVAHSAGRRRVRQADLKPARVGLRKLDQRGLLSEGCLRPHRPVTQPRPQLGLHLFRDARMGGARLVVRLAAAHHLPQCRAQLLGGHGRLLAPRERPSSIGKEILDARHQQGKGRRAAPVGHFELACA